MADYNPDTDPRSSNSLIKAYLASKGGLQPTSENVRRALEGNAANPGLIPGLVNSTPSTEADDQAAMARARAGSGGGGSTSALPTPPVMRIIPGAPQIEGGGVRLGLPAPPGAIPAPVDPAPPQQTAQQTTLPPLDTGDGNDVAMQILRGLGLGAGGSALAGAALGAGRRMMGNRSVGAPGEPTVNLGPTAGAVPGSPEALPTVRNSTATQGPVDRISLGDEKMIGAPPRQITGPPGPQPDARPIAVPEQPIILPASPASPAIDKAVGGEGDVAAPKRVRAPRARTPKVRVPG